MEDKKQFQIAKVLLQEFVKNPRIVIKLSTAGLWPIGPEILRNPDFLKKLANDPEFNKKYELVIMQKG